MNAAANRPTLEDLTKKPLAWAASLSAEEMELLAEDIALIEARAKKCKKILNAAVSEKFAADLRGHSLGTKRIQAGDVDVARTVKSGAQTVKFERKAA